MHLNTHSLVFKQSLLIILGIALVFGVVFLVLRAEITEQFTEILTRQGQEISENNVYRINQIFSESARVGEMVIRQLEKENFSKVNQDEFLEQMLKIAREGRPEILALVIAYEPGVIPGYDREYMRLAKYENNKIVILDGSDYLQKPWFAEAKKSLLPLWREPFIGDFIKEPIAIYTIPFFKYNPDGTKTFAGVVCVDLSLAFLRAAVDEIPIKDSGYAFILSSQGMIVAHPNQEWVFKENIRDLADKLSNPYLQKFYDEVKQQGKGLFAGKISDEREAYTYFTPMESNDWTFGIIFPEKEFFSRLNKFYAVFIVVAAVGFVLMLLVIFMVSVSVSRPLKSLAKVAKEIGSGNFDVPIPALNQKDEIGLFAATFNQMRISLANHIENLKNITAAKEKIESELQVAQQIQKDILPEILPPFPKCASFEIDAFLTPAREVGGDLYDFFILPDNKLGLVIGDVSGKGVTASLFMAVTQTLHRGMSYRGDIKPEEVVTQMNQALCNNNHAGMFVTYLFAVLDLNTNTLTYTNAGHNPFAVISSGGSVSFIKERHGIPLGIRSERVYATSQIKLKPEDTLFFYTDGVPEAKNGNGEFFGMERLESFLREEGLKNASPCQISLDLQKRLEEFYGGAEQFDDITVLSLKVFNPIENKDKKVCG